MPAAVTNGVYSFVGRSVSDPGDGTPLHVHQRRTNIFSCWKAPVRLALGDKTFDAEARARWSRFPGDIPHAWE
jgi:hypothetical protein